MLLTIDIGNTNITLGAFSGAVLQFTARLETTSGKTDDQYAVEIKNLLSTSGTIKIITSQNYSLKIHDAFWIRYPVLEFHLKHNSENIIHSLYFLW